MGPVVSEKIFEFFSHSKSMETINPRGVDKFDPRGMNGTIYQSCWPSGFREEAFFSFFSYCSSGPCGFREEDFFSFSNCKSMETIDPRGVAKFDPRGMIGTIYVEDH